MNNILSEKDYQHQIMDFLQKENGYIIRKNTEYDRLFAIDRYMLFKFLNDTQPDTMTALRKIYKKDTEETIVQVINQAVTSEKSSLVETLKYGIEISNYHLDLMYTKPATTFNETLNKMYAMNVFSVMEEVWASDDERVDLVIFLNGFAIISFELKCNLAGQTYHDAIVQYRTQRDPKTRLFRFKAGTIVNFAMDLEEVYMTTKLAGDATDFRPFNMGRGEGVDSGAGNPIYPDKYSVSYMWEDILKKDTLLDLVSKFVFIDRKENIDETTGKKKYSETVVFPRYHQLDLIRKTLASVYEHKTDLNYLVEHSAGSGKTYSISWLTYRLASIHDADNKAIFDTIIIVTDRVVVDRQLQKAVLSMDHKAGLIRVMDDKCTSADLKRELQNNTKIIATTIQKFPYIVDSVANLKDKHFAVIIDEAHSSTSGKEMQAITKALGSSDDAEILDAYDMINAEMEKSGKQPNVSMFAFTATPKNKTLRLFGRLNPQGQYEAFHLYSMKQAIEENYILDVLQNFTEYRTMYRLNKEIEEDPLMQTNDAKKQIARFIDLHDTNITQRVEVIIEHFRNVVLADPANNLGGQAKAMVVTASRAAAVKYRQAFEDYINKKGYNDVAALVAFSGKVKLDDDDNEYTEVGMNGIREERLPAAFDSDDYNVLIVANKYQVGFDQKKLCAMYVLKKLRGVNAVQTFGRLNRICPPYEKKTFILDFVNKYEDIQKAFAPYYTATLLSGDMDPRRIYDLVATIDGYAILDPMDIENFIQILFKRHTRMLSVAEQAAITMYLQRATKAIKTYPLKEQYEIRMKLRGFVRFYEFLIQASCFKDEEVHKKYLFITYLLRFLRLEDGGDGFDLKGKIRADGFVQKKEKTHENEKQASKPVVKLPMAEFDLTEAKKERLSQIIAEINSKTGKGYDNDVAVKAMLQIKDLMMKSEQLKTSAKNNSEKDFEFAFYDNIDNALIEGLNQNQDFFSLLLTNNEIKKEVLGIFSGEIYKSLRDAA